MHSYQPLIKNTLMVCVFFILAFASIKAQDINMPDSVIAGNYDGSAIVACPGDTITIPLWVKNDENLTIMFFPIAIDSQYIEDDLGGNLFGLMSPQSSPHFDYVNFSVNFPNRPAPGLISYPLFCLSENGPPWEFVPFNSESTWVKIADYRLVLKNDAALIGTTTPILEGAYHVMDGCTVLDHDRNREFMPTFIGGAITIEAPGYAYLPGDANMALGLWPPQILPGDQTYLVNYFRLLNNGCPLEGFYAAGDVNGDCQLIGSDVTRFMNYFRGIEPIEYCPDYEPKWHSAGEVPANAPSGWPNCDQTVTATVKPVKAKAQ